jgi:hypothetical protein
VADLTPGKLVRLRIAAAGTIAAHGTALGVEPEAVVALLDEIDRLRAIVAAAEEYRAECECPAPDLLMRAQRRTELFDALAKREATHGS